MGNVVRVTAPAFLAGVSAAYLWALTGRPNGLSLTVWIAMGLVAGLGAARVTAQLLDSLTPRSPSMMLSGLASALGVAAVLLLPAGWLRLLGGAGFLLMLYLALGLLAGLLDLALRIEKRSPTRSGE